VNDSVSSFNWQNFKGEILRLSNDNLDAMPICSEIDSFIEKLQFAEYLRKLESKIS